MNNLRRIVAYDPPLRRTSKEWRRIVPLFLCLVLMPLLVACNTEQEPVDLQLQQATPVLTQVEQLTGARTVEPGDSELTLPPVDTLAVQGDIVTAGSSTVFPLTEAVAARFESEGYSGQITIDSIGSGAGFERFCVAAESDIANASRPINESERASCQEIGREPIEFRVGTDALAVAVSQENDFVEDVTLEELSLIFSTAETWSDVRPEWPDEAIRRYIPGTDSGTFDYFVEEIFDENEEPILSASNLEQSENDNVLVQGIMGSPYAIGFFGYAFYQENQSQLKPLRLNGAEPSQESVESGEYPLARPLFIYSDAEIMQQKPQVAAFINFYLTNVNDEILVVGYFPASQKALNQSRQKWLEAMGIEQETAADPEQAADESVTLPPVDSLTVQGDIVTAGSSTVFPLTEAMAARFEDEGYRGQITIDSIGTGAGFERFCVAGESDIANASRPINESERASCQKIGREPIEFRVGTDALAVAVSQENDFVEDVTLEELALIFSTAETWSDVRPEWPDEAIRRYIPGTDSGTYDYFVEEIFDENEEPILSASNLEQSENDNVLVQGILGSRNAIGFFGYAFYQENASQLKVLSINSITPSEETVENGEYPLARPLYIYSDAEIMQERPQVAAFINFYLTHVNDEIIPIGYFPASAQALDDSRRLWLEAMDQ